jgi:hypothetical protein
MRASKPRNDDTIRFELRDGALDYQFATTDGKTVVRLLFES